MSAFVKPTKVAEGVKPVDVNGHLVIVRPLKLVDVVTKYGDATAVDLDVLDVDDERIYLNCRWFGKVLVAGLRDQIDQLVLGTVDRGTARNGQSAPWVLVDQTDNPTAVARAERVMQKFPEFGNDAGDSDQPDF